MRHLRAAFAAAFLLMFLCGCLREHSTDLATFDSVATFDQSIIVATVDEPTTAVPTTAKPKTKPKVKATTAPATTVPAPLGYAHEPVDPSFFDDAVFLGDSLTVGLEAYCQGDYSRLGNAKFFCMGGLGYTNATEASPKLAAFNGAEYQAHTCGQVTGANKIFVGLGMNDILSGVNATMQNVYELIGRILYASPSAHIYIEAVTPILASGEHGEMTNANIRVLNDELKNYCSLNGFTYIDINTPYRDGSGCLAYEYCGDPGDLGIHLNYNAYSVWVNTVKCYV